MPIRPASPTRNLKTAFEVVERVTLSFDENFEEILAQDDTAADSYPKSGRTVLIAENSAGVRVAAARDGHAVDFGITDQEGRSIGYERSKVGTNLYHHIFTEVSDGRHRKVTLDDQGVVFEVDDRPSQDFLFNDSPFFSQNSVAGTSPPKS